MSPDKEKDEAAVRRWVEAMFASMGAGDSESFYNQCTDDVIVLPPNMPPLYGIEAMKELTQPWFETYDMKHEILDINVNTVSNIAYAFAQYRDLVTPKEGGDIIENENKAIYILKREPSDVWRATHVMWSSNLSQSPF